MDAEPSIIKESLGAIARQLGFTDCRVAAAQPCLHADALYRWLTAGMHAGMEWMARNPERRVNPVEVLPGCRSVICLAYPYDSPAVRAAGQGEICLYAHGRDYHGILEEKLADLSELLSVYGGVQRAYVDAGPVMERDFAEACGLGWRGKSGLAIRPDVGPRFFIAVILTTLALEPDAPHANRCGTCRRCVMACPTGAIGPNGALDANKCLSYWTIEHKGAIPAEIRPLIGNRLYGCDACVRNCPWGTKKSAVTDERFRMPKYLAKRPLRDLMTLSGAEFAALFKHSPIKRIKREGFLRNACIVMGNTGTIDDIGFLENLQFDSDMVAEHARWAMERIAARHALKGKIRDKSERK